MKFTDNHAKFLIVCGLGFAVVLSLIFLWNERSGLSTDLTVNDSKISSYGTILSGLVGTCWSLASVILFYVALTEQRKDMEVNRNAFSLQTRALTQQIKEFELQTKELEETRKIYLEQSSTQKLQRFETTFFQMLTLHHTLVKAIVLRDSKQQIKADGRDSFKKMDEWFKEVWNKNGDNGQAIIDTYLLMYESSQESLGHYFRNLYHIIKFIDESDVVKKKFYSGLVRAQLSSYELLLLLYNCLSNNGKQKFKPLIERYSLLKNLDWSMIQGGKAIMTMYDAQAYGHSDFEFLETVKDWKVSDIND